MSTKSKITDQKIQDHRGGCRLWPGRPPPTTPKYYQSLRSRGELSRAGAVRWGQGRPVKHWTGEASEGLLLDGRRIWGQVRLNRENYWGEEGQTDGTGNSTSVDKIQDHRSKNSRSSRGLPSLAGTPPTHHSQVLPVAQVEGRALKSRGRQVGSGEASQELDGGGQ